jgi:hypothetical protein
MTRGGWLALVLLFGCGGANSARPPSTPTSFLPMVQPPSPPTAPGLDALSGAYHAHFRLTSPTCASSGDRDEIVDIAITGTGQNQSMTWSERGDAAAHGSGLVDRATGRFTTGAAELSVAGTISTPGIEATRYYVFCLFAVTAAR